MPLSQLKESRSRWNVFAPDHDEGVLDFWTLTISLDALRPNEVAGLTLQDLPGGDAASLSLVDYERRQKVLSLAAHEFTHFVDATSSLWGFRHLRQINDSNNINMHNEQQYYVLKKCHDYMRSIRLPKYYTTVHKELPTDRPWDTSVSSGLLFSLDGKITDRPVIFVNFATRDGKRFVRSPLSAVSLLEASAMAKEIEVRFGLLEQLSDDDRRIEERLVHEELVKYLHRPTITEYSACFHLLANVQKEPDVVATFSGVGVLSRLVLNAPAIAFGTAAKNVKAYAQFMRLSAGDLEVERIRLALQCNDRGALFFLIVVLLPKGILKDQKQFMLGLEAALKAIGLNFEKLRRGALGEALEHMEQLTRATTLPAIRTLAMSGHKNFRAIIEGGLTYPLKSFALPPVVLGDSEMTRYTFSPGEGNDLASYDLDAAFDQMFECQRRVENFAEACI